MSYRHWSWVCSLVALGFAVVWFDGMDYWRVALVAILAYFAGTLGSEADHRKGKAA